jgi:hypothetical protein
LHARSKYIGCGGGVDVGSFYYKSRHIESTHVTSAYHDQSAYRCHLTMVCTIPSVFILKNKEEKQDQ